MTLTTNWIFPIGLGLLASLMVIFARNLKRVPVRIKGNRRKK